MYTIENEQLSAVVNLLGAELSSVVNKSNGLEYLWSGDAAFWGKKSPVLFPIVGTLKDNSYIFNDKNYKLSRHGFAREKIFSVKEQTAASIIFELEDDQNSLAVFPFRFSFCIIYSFCVLCFFCGYRITT